MKLINRVAQQLRLQERPKTPPVAPRLTWQERKIASFTQMHGYAPDVEQPKTFSEKLLKRILIGDDPLYDVYAIKHFAHYFVKSRGIEGLRVARHLKVRHRLVPADFDDLPEAFLIKSSFGSGLNEIVTCKAELDIAAVCDRFNDQLPKVRNARSRTYPDNVAIIEEFIGDPAKGPPDDYKFHCFHATDGRFTCFVQVDSDRFGAHRQTLFDHNFDPVEMQFARQIRHEVQPPRPQALEDMLRIARALSEGFDYIRVDLFATDQGIFFGEMTPFHQGGSAPVTPRAWEDRLGQLWQQRFPVFQPQG